MNLAIWKGACRGVAVMLFTVAMIVQQLGIVYAQGFYVKIDDTLNSTEIVNLKSKIPALSELSDDKVLFKKLENLVFFRIQDGRFCTRGQCATVVVLNKNPGLSFIFVSSSDTLFISDESFEHAGSAGFVVTFLAEAPGVVVKVFVNDEVMIVLP
jgi:hypothetical protein